GLCVVQGLRHEHAMQLLEQRQRQPFVSIDDLKLRTNLNKEELRTLAEIGALNCFVAHRRDALWSVERKIWQDDLFAPKDYREEGTAKNYSTIKAGAGFGKSMIGGEKDSPGKRSGVEIESSLLFPMDALERLR